MVAWTVNITGLVLPGAQHDLLVRAEKHKVSLIAAQETMFNDTSAMSIGPWLRLSSGRAPGHKTGVSFFISPKHREAILNYKMVNDRIITLTMLTKSGPCPYRTRNHSDR